MSKERVVPAKGNPIEKIIPSRYLFAMLGLISMAIIYGLKVNLSVAIVSMVNHTGTTFYVEKIQDETRALVTDECVELNGSKEAAIEDGPFHWPTTVQGTILSSYFWGYMVAQIPGGRLSEVHSSKWVMFYAVAVNVLCALLTPLCAKIHYGYLVAVRVVQGLASGMTFPTMHVMLAHWAPPNERSIMSSICYAGTALGTVISLLLTGFIASSLSWEAAFYIQGGLSAIWLILWGIFIADTPDLQWFISEAERDYINESLYTNGHKSTQKLSVPLKSVFTSMPFYAILVAHTCFNWGWYMLLIELPYYMKTVLKFRISENAMLTALPYLCMWFFTMALGKTLDVLRSKKIITTTTARKVSTGLASIGPLICLISVIYIGCRKGLAVFFMTMAVTLSGGMFSGFLSNHIDIAPNFAGTLMGITNTIATIPGILVPIFVGKLTETDAGIKSWRIIFWITSVFYTIEFIFYTTFGSGQLQPWNEPKETDSNETQPLKSPGLRGKEYNE